MSLILCRQEDVRHPYYIENLGHNIYSSQELCYVLYNHPLLVMDSFVDEHLIAFIKDELKMAILAAKLEKWGRDGNNQDDLLYIILQECDYYSTSEQGRFRQKVSAYRKMHPAEYLKAKADYFFTHKQYKKAVTAYESLLEFKQDHVVDQVFLGRIWNNQGAACARVFQFERALEAFEEAFKFTKDVSVLRQIYYLTQLNPQLVLKEQYENLLDQETKNDWNKQMEVARENAENSHMVQQLIILFDKDPIKRMAGSSELVHKWKQEYRSMT